ncbi:MAG: glycosyltransferase family 9 protein [Bacteroidetes bacterium]|nr:glycosyltransferase family 9 protein [Bacteroidota bacterium]
MEKSMTAKKWLDRGVYLTSMALTTFINRRKDIKSLSFSNILCIKEDEIGDFIYTLPVYEMLRKQFPAAQITVLCRPFGKQILKYCPHVNAVFSEYTDLKGKYDLIIDLRGTIPSTFYALKHPPVIRLDRGSLRYKNRKKGVHSHESEANLEIILPVLDAKNKILKPTLFISEKEREEARKFLEEKNISKYALFHTGARRILKKWPLERVAEIMKWLYTEHGLSCIVVGDEEDAKDAEALRQLTNIPIHQAAGKVNLLVFAALCEKADIYIGNDSGPLHIATVMGAPSIGLYGPGDPIFHPRLPNSRFLHHILECNPCDQVHCKYKEYPCIERITIDEVREKIIDLKI